MKIIRFDFSRYKIEIVEIIQTTKTLYKLSSGEKIKKHSLGRTLIRMQREKYVYLYMECWKKCRERQLMKAKENYKIRKEHIKCALKGTCYEYNKNAFKKIMKELEIENEK